LRELDHEAKAIFMDNLFLECFPSECLFSTQGQATALVPAQYHDAAKLNDQIGSR